MYLREIFCVVSTRPHFVGIRSLSIEGDVYWFEIKLFDNKECDNTDVSLFKNLSILPISGFCLI